MLSGDQWYVYDADGGAGVKAVNTDPARNDVLLLDPSLLHQHKAEKKRRDLDTYRAVLYRTLTLPSRSLVRRPDMW